MSFRIFLFLSFHIFLCSSHSDNSRYEDSPCTLTSGTLGICKPSVSDCYKVSANFNLVSLYQQGISSCYSPTGKYLVCCPNPKLNPNPVIEIENNSTVDEDSPCTLTSGTLGICKPSVSDCYKVSANFNLVSLYQQGISVCNSPTGKYLVCCPNPKLNPNPVIEIENNSTVGVNSPCTMKYGSPGVCKSSVEDCFKVYADFNLSKLHQEGISACNHPTGKYLICCPKSNFIAKIQQSISSKKCMEYNKLRNCGIRLVGRPTIYNGEPVIDDREFPHMAHLGYNSPDKGLRWACGGTLISEQFIATAAHCLNYERSSVSHVRLGSLNRSNSNITALQEYQVIQIFKFPNRTLKLDYNDIALLKLDRPVQLTSAVFPACLHEDTEISKASLTIVGWGETENSKESGELRKARITPVTYNECAKHYNAKLNINLKNGILDESQFCAGGNNIDTCNGDSGGPALMRHTNGCLNSLVGITSFGNKCETGKAQSPSVYTRVSYFVPWIENIIWPNA